MNFYQQQDDARKKTKWLVLLFFAATLLVTLSVNLVFAAAIFISSLFIFNTENLLSFSLLYPAEYWLTISSICIAVILAGSAYRLMSLKQGKDIAESLGAEKLHSYTEDRDEKTLLNVVEEMAIASGMPVPDIYLIKSQGINAFAAGFYPSDAIIGITQGAIQGLNREQLQGVIAHEFSHIFNGDMRLNMRMVGILHGIRAIGIIGKTLIESVRYPGHRREDFRISSLLYITGAGLSIIGYLGDLLGQGIQAAISREREFLADASAVQFTRNPEGIASALKVIGYNSGSRLQQPAAYEVAHFFFHQVSQFTHRFYATHPPLDERINKIEPGWDGYYLPPKIRPKKVDNTQLAQSYPAAIPCFIDDENSIDEALSSSFSSMALLFSLFMLNTDKTLHKRQEDILYRNHGKEVLKETLRFTNRSDTAPSATAILKQIDRLLPNLRDLSVQQYKKMNKTLIELAKADNKIELTEWCMYRLVMQYLGRHFNTLPAIKQKHSSINAIADDIAVVMGYVASAGSTNPNDMDMAYRTGMSSEGIFWRERQSTHTAEASLKDLNLSLTRINESSSTVKEKVLNAFWACIQQDKNVTDKEKVLFTCIAAILETPYLGHT